MKISLFFTLLTFVFQTFAQVSEKNGIQNTKPFIIGTIDEFQSQILSEKRLLNIYLPEGYNPNDTVKYDVTYLLDGSADEDFIHVVGLYQFNSFEWINRTPKTIVVGIANIDRKRDFTFPTKIEEDKKHNPTSGNSDKFMVFIEKELQPYIEKKYKTTSSKTLIGQSLGGLFATEVLFKKPYMFNKYIIISPSIWWDNGSILNQASPILDSTFTQFTNVYIGVGKEGLTPTKLARVMEVDANLLAEKIKSSKSKTINIYFDYLPEDNHATICHHAIFNALKVIYTKKQ